MPDRHRLTLEVEVLEVELALLAELAGDGRVLPGLRAPSTAEIRAGVRFAELDKLVEDTAARLDRLAGTVREHTLDALALDLGQLYGQPPGAVAQRLNDLLDPMAGAQLDGLRDVVDGATGQAVDELATLHHAAGAQAVSEATRQGIPAAASPARLSPGAELAIRAQAQRVAAAPVTRLLTVARDAAVAAGPEDDPVAAALDAAEQASTAGITDTARQAASVAHDTGRSATLRAIAGAVQPREVYASELLDRNTCQPCSYVDGRTYATLEEALRDYPGNGGYHACEGGQRCRGTLVVVWDTEAAPTIDNRRGPDPGAAPTPPPPPPAPPSRPHPSTLSDDDLMAGLADAMAAGDTALEQELGDELDRRDAEAQRIAEPPPSPAETAPDSWGWSADDEARIIAEEYAGNPEAYAAQLARDAEQAAQLGDAALLDAVRSSAGGARPAGRRIDTVRDEWAAELERRYVELEDATVGDVLRRDRLEEFHRKYGAGAAPDVLLAGPARVAYYYASEAVRAYWAARPRITFAEYAVQRGIRDAKTLERARRAAEARDEAVLRAEEDRTRDRYKARKRPAIPQSAGDRLRRDQARAARERRRAEDLQKRAPGEAGGLP